MVSRCPLLYHFGLQNKLFNFQLISCASHAALRQPPPSLPGLVFTRTLSPIHLPYNSRPGSQLPYLCFLHRILNIQSQSESIHRGVGGSRPKLPPFHILP